MIKSVASSIYAPSRRLSDHQSLSRSSTHSLSTVRFTVGVVQRVGAAAGSKARQSLSLQAGRNDWGAWLVERGAEGTDGLSAASQ